MEFLLHLQWLVSCGLFLKKQKQVMSLKSVGFNDHASQYAGMNVKKNIVLSMVISGAFAGLAGAMEALGTFGNMVYTWRHLQGLDLTELQLHLLGANTPLGVIFGAIVVRFIKIWCG